MTRRILSLLCALMMLLSFSFAQAEETDNIQAATSDSFSQFYKIPDSLYYKGGMVIRGFLKGADTTAVPLELAYVLTSMPYIILNQPSTWELTITGGTGDYTCYALLAYQEDLSADEFGWWDTEKYFAVEGNSFDYTFTKPGRYFWEFRVMDDGGQFFSFQTRIYEAYTEEDETDETTVVGKVNSIIDEYITEDMSDYTRAKVLHDWLIYNANYDYTYTNYDASGVLLKGTGVCDSYARAYLMLCTAAGLECMYISGTAGSTADPTYWGAHGWNMVKLGGSWYHVDCTWDDPGQGGYECHDYFCVDDETMAKDHRWNKPDDVFDSEGYLPPDAEGGEYENNDDNGGEVASHDFTFADMAEYDAKFDAFIASGERHSETVGKYTGSDYNGIWQAFNEWAGVKIQELFNQGLITGSEGISGWGNLFTVYLDWADPTEYIRIDENTLRLSIGEETIIMPTDYYPMANAFTWKSSDTSIATVSADYDAAYGLIATITGVSAGEATITATSADGHSDSITVTVMPAFAPDFGFNAATDAEGVTLSWESIPGVTEYRIYRRYNGADTLLETSVGSRIYMSKEQLPNDVQQELYIVGVRVVGDETVFAYTSEPITYGRLTLSYESTLPAALTVIGDEAFANCTDLTSFKVPSKATSIGARAFYGCTSLTTVRIPASVTSIGDGAFTGCPLKYAEVSEGSYAESWLLTNFPDITLVY